MTFTERLLDTLKRLLTSGKVLTAVVGMIVALAARRGVVLNPEDVQSVLLIFGVLLGAQGAADWGKSAAQVKAQGPPETIQTQTVNVEGKK